MPGHEERHHFVPHFDVRHVRLEQRRQQIVATCAARANDAIDELVQLMDGAHIAPITRRGHPVRQHEQQARQPSQKMRADHGRRVADHGQVRGDLGPEQRPARDLQRELHHVLVHIAHVARLPAGCLTLGVVDDDLARGVDPRPMKRRLGEPTLPPPRLTVAAQ